MTRNTLVTASSVRKGKEAAVLNQLTASITESLKASKSRLVGELDEVERLKAGIEAHDESTRDIRPVPIDDVISDSEYKLDGKQKELAECELQALDFAQEHNIDRKPVLPNILLNVLILVLAVFVEAGINASFFNNAHLVASPFSALLVSLLIALTNVVVSVSAGFYIGPRLNYGNNAVDSDNPEYKSMRDRAKKLFIAFLVLMVFFHLTVGLIRSLERLDKLTHSVSVYIDLLLTPEAIFLIMLGACLSAFSFYKGQHGFTDPYLSYGQYGRAKERIQDDINNLYEDGADRIEERFDERLDEIEQEFQTRQAMVEEYNNAVKIARQSHQGLESGVLAAKEMLHSKLISQNRSGAKSSKKLHAPLLPFDRFLQNCHCPSYLSVPSLSAHKDKLALARTESLQRLAELFNSNLNN